MTYTTDDTNDRLWRMAVERAEAQIGSQVFAFVSKEVRRALIAEQVLTLLVAQDEEVSDRRVREAMTALDEILGRW